MKKPYKDDYGDNDNTHHILLFRHCRLYIQPHRYTPEPVANTCRRDIWNSRCHGKLSKKRKKEALSGMAAN